MKPQLIPLLLAFTTVYMIAFAYTIRFMLRLYRRFCIKVLWKRFHIRTSAYHRWHARRAAKLQLALDCEHSLWPSF